MRRFEEMNPLCAAFYYLCVLGLTMFGMNPLTLSLSLLSSILSAVLFGAVKGRGHTFSLILFLIAALINPLIVHNGVTVLFYFNDNPITLEAVLYGLTAAGMITASLYWLRCLSKVMTSDKVLYIFGRFSPKLALLLSMSLRFIELLRVRWRKIQDTQKALGLYRDGNLIDALRGRARVLSVLIGWTLENGIVTAESMEGRGYGSGRRTSYSAYRMHLSDWLFLPVCAGLTAAAVVGQVRSTVVFYPDMQMELWNLWGVLGAAAFAVLGTLPLIINAKEALRWRGLLSKV